MRRFIFVIVILMVSVWLGLRVAEDPGLALLAYKDWSIEMPLWFAGICLIVFMLILYYFARFLGGVKTSFYRLENWLHFRRKNKSYNKTNRGLIELIEGHWHNAERYLLKGLDQADAPLINYLAAAYAAHAQGAYDKRDRYLRQAHDVVPHAHIAISLTQAQLQFDQGQLEQALATLNHLRTLSPLQRAALKLLQKIYIPLSDWQGLLTLLPSLRKVKLLSHDQAEQLEQHVYQEMLASIAHKATDVKILHDFWKTIPRKLQKNPRIIYCYAAQLKHYPDTAIEIEGLINKTVKKHWDTDLVKLYGLLTTPYPQKQLEHAEKWLKIYPEQPALLLTLGRLCMHCQLWGKARMYLQHSLQQEESVETYAEYGRLVEHLGDTPAAAQIYRDGLALKV